MLTRIVELGREVKHSPGNLRMLLWVRLTRERQCVSKKGRGRAVITLVAHDGGQSARAARQISPAITAARLINCDSFARKPFRLVQSSLCTTNRG